MKSSKRQHLKNHTVGQHLGTKGANLYQGQNLVAQGPNLGTKGPHLGNQGPHLDSQGPFLGNQGPFLGNQGQTLETTETKGPLPPPILPSAKIPSGWSL